MLSEDVLEPEDGPGEDGWLRHLKREQGPRYPKTALKEPRKEEKDEFAIATEKNSKGVQEWLGSRCGIHHDDSRRHPNIYK